MDPGFDMPRIKEFINVSCYAYWEENKASISDEVDKVMFER
jgi:hypothetical protein